MNDQEAAAYITRAYGPYLVPRRTYPLIPELARWYCYLSDSGHSIIVALSTLYTPGSDPDTFLVPASPKTVLRAGHTITPEGFILTDIPYNDELGLITPPDDYEF